MLTVSTDKNLIRMYGSIGGGYEDGITALDFIEALDAMEGRDVEIHLQSDGGSVPDGFSMYNSLKNYPGRTTVLLDAYAASIATVFPMAADEVQAYDNLTFMVHKAWTIALGNSNDLRIAADVLDQLDGEIAKMYAKRTGQDVAYWLAKMTDETYMTAASALDEGLIDKIIDTGDSEEEAENKASASKLAPKASVGDFPALQTASVALQEAQALNQPRPGLAALEARLRALKTRRRS